MRATIKSGAHEGVQIGVLPRAFGFHFQRIVAPANRAGCAGVMTETNRAAVKRAEEKKGGVARKKARPPGTASCFGEILHRATMSTKRGLGSSLGNSLATI
jgi:hypothetical protein